MIIKYFTFVGSYGGAAKIDGEWYRISQSHGSYAIHGYTMYMGYDIERVKIPKWAYIDDKFMSLPKWKTEQEQKELAAIWILRSK